MNVLLDTHVWLWYHLGSSQLTATHRELIEDEEIGIWLSPISVWETHLLIERGRLSVDVSPAAWLSSAFEALRVGEARLTWSIAQRARSIVLHEDPADRFLAATAIENNYHLATVDERLKGCKTLKCI